MDVDAAYTQGFVEKCAEYGVDPEELVKRSGVRVDADGDGKAEFYRTPQAAQQALRMARQRRSAKPAPKPAPATPAKAPKTMPKIAPALQPATTNAPPPTSDMAAWMRWNMRNNPEQYAGLKARQARMKQAPAQAQ